MNIGIDIDNTITEVQEELNNAAYEYAIKLGKNIENAENPFEDIKNNGDTYKKKFQFSYEELKYFLKNIQYDSYCLYLPIEENQQIKELQRIFYKEFPKEKYNPDNFVFHMTLHIDKDYNKVLNLQRILKENFEPFFLEFNKLALFDYPGELIKKININEE